MSTSIFEIPVPALIMAFKFLLSVILKPKTFLDLTMSKSGYSSLNFKLNSSVVNLGL